MARSTLTPINLARIGIVAIVLAALAGCQQQSHSSDSLPPIVLDGPRLPMPAPAAVAPPTTVPSAPVIVAKAPTPPRPQAPAPPDGWIPPVAARPWQWIIIHHTATTFGNAQIIDAWHRNNGWDELGYHFVIGNGSNSGDGQVEIGPRWPKQKWGAHTKTADNRFNDYGIGICLVGNFDVDHPTDAQMQSVAKLVAFLMQTYHIPADHVLGHGEAKPTDCPGRFMSVAEVVKMAGYIVAKQDADKDSATARLAAAKTFSDVSAIQTK